MSPPDDHPEIAPAEPEWGSDAWVEALHRHPAYLKILDEIDLDDDSPGIPAEKVLAWVKSWGTENELPKPEPE